MVRILFFEDLVLIFMLFNFRFVMNWIEDKDILLFKEMGG